MHERRHYWAVALLQSQALATDLTLNGLGQSCNARVRRASCGVCVQECYYVLRRQRSMHVVQHLFNPCIDLCQVCCVLLV